MWPLTAAGARIGASCWGGGSAPSSTLSIVCSVTALSRSSRSFSANSYWPRVRNSSAFEESIRWPMSTSSTGPPISSRLGMPTGSTTITPSTARPVAVSYIWAIALPTLGMSGEMVTLLQYLTATPPSMFAP